MNTERGELSDEELMLRLQEGDDNALGSLMQRWEIPTKRFIFRLIGNAAEAEDLAQESFVRVYIKRDSYRRGAKFSSWLFTIAANQAKNRLRWWKRRPTLSLNEWIVSGGDTEDETSSAASHQQRAETEARIAEVQTAISDLPHDERTALVLFEYENKSMAEIGAIVGGSVKAVENRLYRARRKLAQILG